MPPVIIDFTNSGVRASHAAEKHKTFRTKTADDSPVNHPRQHARMTVLATTPPTFTQPTAKVMPLAGIHSPHWIG